MQTKTTIRRWKKPIIRWALRELKAILPALYGVSYEKLSEFGLGDISKGPLIDEYAIYIDPDL